MALEVTGVQLIAEDAAKYLRDMGRAEDVTQEFGRTAQTASVGTIALGTALGDLAAGAVRQVTGLLVDAGRAAVGFLADGVTGARDLEAQMSGVAAVLGGTQDELAQLQGLVRDLGIDPNLKVSTIEAAQAIEVLAKNGLDMQQILDGAARSTVLLANATGAEFATAADIMTDAASVFNVEASEMIDVVDGISAVTSSSKFDINDYALALANGGATAETAGVSLADFNTTIAAISPSFSSGMTAGTSFKNFLLRLVPSTDSASAAMQVLGLITEDGANAFFRADGSMRDMAEVAGILQRALSGLSEQQQSQALRTIFGNDAMGAAIALAKVGQDEFTRLSETMAQVDAGAAAATRVDNLAGALDILDGVIESVSLQIGNAALPVLTELARRASAFIEQNSGPFIEFFERSAVVVGDFVGQLLDGVPPLDAFGNTLAGAVSPQTLQVYRDSVATLRNLVAQARELGRWATENGPEITRAVKGIGAAVVTFKTITTVSAGISALTAVTASATTAFVAAGGGLSGLVAILGGPVIVAAAAAAAAIGGIVTAVDKLQKQNQEFTGSVQQQIADLRTTSEATGDYTEEAQRLTEALELTTSGLGRFTGLSDDVKAAIVDLILRTGDFSAGSLALKRSLEEVFGAAIEIDGTFIRLNGTIVAFTPDVEDAARAALEAAEAYKNQGAQIDEVSEKSARLASQLPIVTGMTAEQANATREAAHQSSLLAAQSEELADKLTQKGLQAAFAAQALHEEALAEEEANEAAVRAAEIREQTAAIIGEAMVNSRTHVAGIIGAFEELDEAQAELATRPWDQDLVNKAAAAEEGVSAEFAALAESHRQMVVDIFVQNAQLEDGFNESAANIAVALGLMTREEANLRLQTEETVRQIGLLSERLLQTFLEDGEISRQEAELLEAAIKGIEDGSFTAGEAIAAFAQDGLGDLIEGTRNATEESDTLKDRLLFELPIAAEEATTRMETAFEGGDWRGIGTDIAGGVASGISQSSAIADAAANAVNEAISAAKAAAGIASPARRFAIEIGMPVAEGVAAGIQEGTPLVVTAVTDLVDSVEEAFDLSRVFGRAGSAFVRELRRGFIDPAEERLAELDELLAGLDVGVGANITDFLSPGQLQALQESTGLSLREIVELDRERVELAEQLATEQERILELQRQQEQLAFLQAQFRLVSDLRDAGLDPADILGGLQLGVDASLPGLIDAMSAAIGVLIGTVEDELEIASPSRVFATIGEEVTAGLAVGIATGAQNVTSTLSDVITGLTDTSISPPASALQTFSTTSTIDNSMTITYQNNSGGAPIRDRDELAFLLGSVR